MISAFEAIARFTSDSLMPPTAAYTSWTFTSSFDSFASDCDSASCEPCTSAFTMIGSIFTSPAVISVNMFSSLAACCLASFVLRNLPAR